MSTAPRRHVSLTLLCLAVAAANAQGQGIVVDRRPGHPVAGSYEVDSVALDAVVREQVARVRVSQTLSNPTSGTIEAEYLFPVPDASAIQDFVLLVDGKELAGEVMDADKARRIYEDTVRRQRDPALLEYMGKGLIRTSVFPIPPREKRTITMTYSLLLPRDRDVVEFSYPFGTQKFSAKPIRSLDVSIRVESKTPIKSIYSPSHEVQSELVSDHEARLSYRASHVIPTADLRVFYAVAPGGLGASVLSVRPDEEQDGYFLLLASPEVAPKARDREPASKTVVFVLDRSGSMSGKKIEQARDALKFVLNNLRPDDTFNVVVYDDRVETFKPELQRLGPESRAEALRYVENIRPGGSTNIDAALRTSLEMLRDDSRPQYVLFLTDGLPTVGEQDELKLAEIARRSNADGHARIFPFGVGYDVNARLLDRIAAENGGTTTYVTPDEDIEASVSRFYEKITSPVLADLRVEIDGTDVNRTYPRTLPDLFEGGQVAWVGRYSDSGKATVRITGKVGDERRSFAFEAELARPGEGTRYDFVEPLWASRRIGEIIDQIDLHGKNDELVDELVRLSTRYGILTPYTSFLANEETDLRAARLNARQAGEQLSRLGQVQGQAGVGLRQNKALYQRADRLPSSESLIAPAPTNLAAGPRHQGGFPGGSPAVQQQAGQVRPGITFDSGGAMMMGGGMMGGMSGGMGGMGMGRMAIAQDLEGNAVPVASVRQVGPKTFYFRQGRWIDSTVTAEAEKEAKVLTQFSDPYFDLSRRLSPEQNQYLGFSQPVVVAIDGAVYRIEPETTEGEDD